MDRQLNSEIKRYRREIKQLLLCKNTVTKAFMKDFDNELFAFVDENDVSDMEAIYAQFGTAEEVARSFFEFADIQKISKWMRCKKAMLSCLIVALCVALMGTAYIAEDLHSDQSGFLSEAASEYVQ